MYYICKYSNCWVIHDAITGGNRKLRLDEIAELRIEFESLMDEKVITVYTEKTRSLLPVLKDCFKEDRNNSISHPKSLIDLHG